VKKTAAVAGKRNDRGSFGGRGGGVAMAKERANMRCRWTCSWRRGLVAGSAGGEREGTAKNRPRPYPQRGQAGAGASAAGACRAATAGIRQGGRWELRNGRRLRSAKQALAGTSAERATAREAGKIFENRNAQKAKCTWKLKPSSSSYTPHVDFFSCFLVLNFSYHRLGFSSSSFFFFFFPFSFSYSLRSPLCGATTPTPTPLFSSGNILLKVKS
jgi:hypothetical protein